MEKGLYSDTADRVFTQPKEKQGVICHAINCDHNRDERCSAKVEITAGGACQTYSKDNYDRGDNP